MRAARKAGLYVSLITSGLPLDERKLADLVEAGADHSPASFQGASEETGREFGYITPHRPQYTSGLTWLTKSIASV